MSRKILNPRPAIEIECGAALDCRWPKKQYCSNQKPRLSVPEPIFGSGCTLRAIRYQDDWARLFKEVKNNHTPPGPMNINNKSSYWVLFCKGILSGAAFLSEFKTDDAFNKFVKIFCLNDMAMAALPMVIEQEVYPYKKGALPFYTWAADPYIVLSIIATP